MILKVNDIVWFRGKKRRIEAIYANELIQLEGDLFCVWASEIKPIIRLYGSQP